MSGQTQVSLLLRIAAAIIVVYAFVSAVAPFSATTSGPHYALRSFRSQGSSEKLVASIPLAHCNAPVVDAWHAPSESGGWFGYAPLTETTIVSGSGCRASSRQRLRVSALGLIAAAGLVLVARRIDRRPGFGLDPAPT